LSGHCKRKRNLITNKKGFSSIVGAVFAILVIVSLTGTFFVWSIQENARYVDTVRSVDQLALDRQSESLNITSVPYYSCLGQDLTTAVGVQNDGPIYVNITTLWVQDLNDTQTYGYKSDLNRTLLPGGSWPIVETIHFQSDVTNHNFTGWLVTQRGNVMPLYVGHLKGDPGDAGYNGTAGSKWYAYPLTPLEAEQTYGTLGVDGDFYLNTITNEVFRKVGDIWSYLATLKGPAGPVGPQGLPGAGFNETGDIHLVNGTDFNATGNIHLFNGTTAYDANTALISQGIGSIAMNFKSFLMYTVNGSGGLMYASPAYTFALGTNIAFSLNVTNMDPTGGVINLTRLSCLWIFSPASGAIKGQQWPLATVNNNVVTPLAVGQSLTLAYNQSTRIYFGPVVGTGNNLNTGISGVNLILTGKVGMYDYGQNLPFITLIIT